MTNVETSGPGVPVASTNYIKADVQVGRTTLKDQAE
jgi:hypothetical protein